MSDYSILVVDDEPIARENLDFILRKEGHAVRAVDGGKAACQELDRRAFDLVMTDLKMRQIDGMQVLERAKELYPDIEVIILTGYATVATAVEAMQKGAYHYLAKPYSTEEVRVLVRKALEKRQLSLQVQDLKRQLQSQQGIPWLIGKNEKIEWVFEVLPAIAASPSTVLVLGETGTGKELV
ncbi:MAG TPA: Fis family transcriptional regulator, partial [Desulfobacterales bacterium]|nr:Fis family transcriptional regulator [Desulfobacterales bacterium]